MSPQFRHYPLLNVNRTNITMPISIPFIVILICLFKFKQDNECIDEEIQASITPRLVGAGEVGNIKPLYIAGEGKILMKVNSATTMANALGLLVSCFYVFNIEYPASCKNVFLFLEAAMMQRTKEAKKRVAINKFLQQLE